MLCLMLCAPLDWQYAELPSSASDAVLWTVPVCKMWARCSCKVSNATGETLKYKIGYTKSIQNFASSFYIQGKVSIFIFICAGSINEWLQYKKILYTLDLLAAIKVKYL